MSAGTTWSWGLLPFALSALLTALCAVFAWQRRRNPSAEALFRARPDYLGRHIDELLVEGTASRLCALGAVSMFELTVGTHVFEARSEPLDAKRGKPQGRVVLLRDVTARKQAEQALQRIHEALEVRVEERTRELYSANEAMALEIAGRERAERERSVGAPVQRGGSTPRK